MGQQCPESEPRLLKGFEEASGTGLWGTSSYTGQVCGLVSVYDLGLHQRGEAPSEATTSWGPSSEGYSVL